MSHQYNNGMDRFSRIIQVIGDADFEKLQKARITIFGLGAVGAWAAEILARSGVGNFTLVDFDRIARTNINRHVCAMESTIGTAKVDAAKERVLDINPKANVSALQMFVDDTNLAEILSDNPDIVIDAIDSVGPKSELLAQAYKKGLKVISSMGAALKTDLTAIRTGDLFDTKICPLARNMRKYLRDRGVGRGIECVYSTEFPDNKALKAPVEENTDDPQYKRGRVRNILGSYPPVTALFGITLADMAIKKLIE